MDNKEIKKLGWKAIISDQIGGDWLTFSLSNTATTKFSGCSVTIEDDSHLLKVTPTGSTVEQIINIGDILFDYDNNTSETTERKATVTLIQNDSNITHVYIFTQMEDMLVNAEYGYFECYYNYYFEDVPPSGTTIPGSGGTINIYSHIDELDMMFSYTKTFLSGKNPETTWFKYVEINGSRSLYSRTYFYDPDDPHFIPEWDEIYEPVQGDYDSYLNEVTHILKRKYPDSFFGFSSQLYENEFTYKFSSSTDSQVETATVYSNLVTSTPKGQHFDVTVGVNPLEEFKRTISITGTSFSYIPPWVTSNGKVTSNEISGHDTFSYIQESGYTQDERRFSLTVFDNGTPFSSITANSEMFFVEKGGNKVYVSKGENGAVFFSSNATTMPSSAWTQYDYHEGTRPYPEYNEDEVIKIKGEDEVYHTSESGNVCVYYSTGWTKTNCSGRQEACEVNGYNVIFYPNSESNKKDGNCYCGNSDNADVRSIDYTFEALEPGTTNKITGLTFSQTVSSATIEISSYSACSGNWYVYQSSVLQDPCIDTESNPDDNHCPCEIVNNKLEGTNYDHVINFSFAYDYKKLAGKTIRFNLLGSTLEEEKFAEFFIPSKYAGGMFEDQQVLSPLSDYYVDLGLTSKNLWAIKNIDAKTPEDYGSYFSWGNIEGHAFNTYTFSANEYEKTKGHSIDKNLKDDNDAAYANIGEEWKMPTTDDYQELFNKCNYKWVTNYKKTGVNGILLSSKNDNTKQIFLPAAGVCYDTSIWGNNSNGLYWTSIKMLFNNERAYRLNFTETNVHTTDNPDWRRNGLPIRPILKTN